MNPGWRQATAEDVYSKAGSMCTVAAIPQRGGLLKLDAGENAFEEDGPSMPLVMGGMTMKNFNPARYSGRWFEVASLKLGFSGQGQEDCHCTQVNAPSYSSLCITVSWCIPVCLNIRYSTLNPVKVTLTNWYFNIEFL